MSSTTTMTLKTETMERFKKFGVYGESANDILERLMDIADKKGGKNQIKRK